MNFRNFIECKGKSWAWKQGWLSYWDDPFYYDNPHEKENKKEDFSKGWSEASFQDKLDSGYFDWSHVRF